MTNKPKELATINKRFIQIPYKDKLLKFGYNSESELESSQYFIREQFIKEVYRWLPIKNKVVIDVGGNIADTAIYFSVNGAKKVIAYEADIKYRKRALENLRLNKITNAIYISKACNSLENLVNINKLADLNPVLKIDCDGCEYNLISNSSKRTLRVFKYIIIEYTYGYRNLIKKLKESNFDIRFTYPTYHKSNNPFYKNPNLYFGFIYAIRN